MAGAGIRPRRDHRDDRRRRGARVAACGWPTRQRRAHPWADGRHRPRRAPTACCSCSTTRRPTASTCGGRRCRSTSPSSPPTARSWSSATMEPCLQASSDSCARYAPEAPVLTALEVPAGRLADLGVGPGSQLEPRVPEIARWPPSRDSGPPARGEPPPPQQLSDHGAAAGAGLAADRVRSSTAT